MMRMLPLVIVALLGLLVLIRPALSRAPQTASAARQVPAALGGPTVQVLIENGWDASYFDYAKPAKLDYHVSQPTREQLSFVSRPSIDSGKAIIPTTIMPEPVATHGIEFLHVRFRNTDGEVVPMLLAMPAGKSGPFPVVLAVHGLHSNKAQVIGQLGRSLTKRGFAILAPDMPWHGERPGNSRDVRDNSKIWQRFANYKRGVIDVRQALDVAEQLPQLDLSNGVSFAGYSMGSFIGSVAGPADSRIKDMVLLVGGAIEFNSWLTKLPQVAAVDGSLAIAHFAGRPLLFLNASDDECITRPMSDRLYAAAPQPKEQRWYDCGHLLPEQAYDDAAAWIAQRRAEVGVMARVE